jgi:hypothetical protein
VKSNHVDLTVTPNHRMLYRPYYTTSKFKIKKAEDLYHTRYRFKKNVDNWEPDYSKMPEEIAKHFIIKDGVITKFRFVDYSYGIGEDGEIDINDRHICDEFIMNIDDWLTVYGIYIAEGHVSNKWVISIAAFKERVRDALDEIANKRQVRITEILQDGEYNVRHLCNQLIVKHLGFGHIAITKKLKDWVWWLNMEQCRTLLHGMCLGDGCWDKDGNMRYYTSSNDLADGFMRLCLHAGYSTNKILKTEKGTRNISLEILNKRTKEGRGQVNVENIESYSNADYWMMSIIKSQNEPSINKEIKGKKHKDFDKNVYHDEYIDYDGKVYCCTVPEGKGIIYVRKHGTPIWCGQSRMAQKGTIGMVYPQHDMPFSKDGITPDIIMNPHAIPSRMTMGQLLECILGKTSCMVGSQSDSTPFNKYDIRQIGDILESYGMERHGNEILYNGRTGEQIKTEIFIGPTYYQRLKHMVVDKIHSRGSNGPIVFLTRQPSEGRSRKGGLRIGEMERDAILCHGLSTFLKEKMLDSSDLFKIYICKKCGICCIYNSDKKIYRCQTCKNDADICQVRLPYSYKLLVQELNTMNIATRMIC